MNETCSAWSEELRAPVSTLAFTAEIPSSGMATHSRQPSDSFCVSLGTRAIFGAFFNALRFGGVASAVIPLRPVQDRIRERHPFWKIALLKTNNRWLASLPGALRNEVNHGLNF